MTPRGEIVAIAEQADRREVFDVFARNRHTRYPVYQRDIDDIIGVVDAKQIVLDWTNEQRDWRTNIQPPLVLPETVSVEQIVTAAQSEGVTLIVLADEYSGTAGVITVTDIASRLILNANAIREIRAGRYLVAGDTNLEELEAALEITLLDDDEPRDFETLGGLIMAELNRVPQTGDEVQLGDLRLRVTVMRGRRVMQVMLDISKRSKHAAA